MLQRNFNSFYWPKTISFCQTKDEIISRMKDSDFFVINKKGTRRMIGMKYDGKTMDSPKVTFVAMRQELPFAKQIAFSLGKEVFYDDCACRALFDYFRGEYIAGRDFRICAKLYSKVWYWRD